MAKNIILNVDISFSVSDDYEITDLETVEFGNVRLMDGSGNKITETINPRHASVATIDNN
jgi:hypothetical protein